MKPVNELAFKNICENFSCRCMGYCSEATYITMEEIAHDCDPFTYEEEEVENNFIENIVCKIYEMVITKYGFQEYIAEYLFNAIDLRLSPEYYGQPQDEECEISYDDFDSFIDDIDYSFLNKNLKRCWDRACITDQPFSDDETIKLLTSDRIGTSEFI